MIISLTNKNYTKMLWEGLVEKTSHFMLGCILKIADLKAHNVLFIQKTRTKTKSAVKIYTRIGVVVHQWFPDEVIFGSHNYLYGSHE